MVYSLLCALKTISGRVHLTLDALRHFVEKIPASLKNSSDIVAEWLRGDRESLC